LLQELGNNLTRVIRSLLLHVAWSDLLTPAAHSAYVTSLAEQLLLSIRTFVNLHPRSHINTTHPNVVINTLLLYLLTQRTISQMLFSQIIEQLLHCNQQEAASIQLQAVLLLFHNYNQVRYPSHLPLPNLPQLPFARSDVTIYHHIDVVPRDSAQIY
jgi:hypothetical protein